jgi:hypothetical protein
VKLRAAQRAIDRKAPFHRDKNSMADALIVEMLRRMRARQKIDLQSDLHHEQLSRQLAYVCISTQYQSKSIFKWSFR